MSGKPATWAKGQKPVKQITVGSDVVEGVAIVDSNGNQITTFGGSVGTAGVPSADVLTVQGVTSMTPIKVDGSGVTQPVSGTVTATGPLTDTQLRATAVPVSGPLTDTQLRATAVPVSGTVTATGPLTDAQLRATAVPVDTELTTADLDTGAGTDTRAVVGIALAASGGAVLAGAANPVPVSGTVAATQSGTWTVQPGNVANTTAWKVDGSAVTQPVSAASLPLPTGASTEATLAAIKAKTDNLDVLLSTRTKPADTQTVSGTVTANVTPATSGGLSISRTISAASTNATSAKASAGQVFGWYLSNVNASPRYLKLYNKASVPTVGTDVPVLTILIPGNTAGAGANVEFTNGIAFSTGIAYAITTGVTDADTGAVAANEIVVNLLYK